MIIAIPPLPAHGPSLASVVKRQDRDEYKWGVDFTIGQSASILGSEELRHIAGLGISHSRPEPKLKLWSVPGQMVVEGYYQRTHHAYGRFSPASDVGGVLVMGRWHGKEDASGQRFFFDFGWGLQYGSHITTDLDSHLNSTPVVDFGATFPLQNSEFMIALRFLHASNAGLVGRNQGTNQLLLLVGFRF